MIDSNENEKERDYPGRTVLREGAAIVVSIPVRFHRRNGRQTVQQTKLTAGNHVLGW